VLSLLEFYWSISTFRRPTPDVSQYWHIQTAKYLENARKQRGLVFKAWITCKPSNQTQTTEFAFTHDAHWLPSYVPGAYQFRQTVILSGSAPPTAQESAVAGEVCLMPKRRYVSQIAGQCDGKFAVWK